MLFLLDVKRAIQCQRTAAASSIMSSLSTALELNGNADDDEDIYEHFLNMKEDALLSAAEDHLACTLIWIKRKFVSVMKNDMEGAITVYELSLDHPFGSRNVLFKTVPYITSKFLDGIIAFYSARKNKSEERKWLAIGMESLRLMKKWRKLSAWNFESKLLLLEAEHLYQKGSRSALDKYGASITAARKHHFIHEEGLAYSKLGHYHLSQGRSTAARESFDQAKRCYSEWGATSLLKNPKVW